MNETPPLASRYTEILLAVARDKGVDPARLLGDDAAKLLKSGWKSWDNQTLGEVNSRLAFALEDEFWGLLGHDRVPIGSLQFALELGCLSGNLGEALTRIFTFYGLVTKGIRPALIQQGDTAAIAMELPEVEPEYAAFVCEWWLWLWHFLAQWLAGVEIDRAQVEFPHSAIGSLEDYRTAFGPNCKFQRGEARVTFDRKVLSLRVMKTPLDVELMYRKVKVVLSAPEVEKSWRTIVLNALNAELSKKASFPTMSQLAATWGLCAQTLRRRLVDEGTSYRELKAEVRANAATRLAGMHFAKWSDIAEGTGFAEVNGLARFIRHTTGMTLEEFRLQRASSF